MNAKTTGIWALHGHDENAEIVVGYFVMKQRGTRTRKGIKTKTRGNMEKQRGTHAEGLKVWRNFSNNFACESYHVAENFTFTLSQEACCSMLNYYDCMTLRVSSLGIDSNLEFYTTGAQRKYSLARRVHTSARITGVDYAN